MHRRDAKILIEEIKKQVTYREKLSAWENTFLSDLELKSSKYGMPITDKQGKILSQIYSKVWEDIWAN